MKLGMEDLERVARFFRAFSEPTRLALLQELKGGPRVVGDLVEGVPSSQANVSKQLKHLHDAGLLTRRREGTQTLYELAEPVVMEMCRLACDQLNQRPKPRRLRF